MLISVIAAANSERGKIVEFDLILDGAMTLIDNNQNASIFQEDV